MKAQVLCSALLSLAILTSCGGSSDSNSNDSALTGIFIDSAVAGLTYNTDTLSGTTDANGRYQYIAGETIVFSIGSLVFPSVTATEQITPISLATGSSAPSATATNIARLIQSLDVDGNPDNGITIPADIASTVQIAFDVSVVEFETNPDVINLVANSGSSNTELISADQANAHMNLALATASTNADIMSFSTGADLLAAGGAALTNAQLESAFRGRKFISLDGSFDWEFFLGGTADSFDLAGTDQDYLEQAWSIEGNKLCRERGDNYPCVTVFALGEAFRLSLDGRDGTDGLESWGLRYAN